MGKRCAAGKRLEDFHYGWEAMVGLLRAGTEIRLTEHYNGATFYLGSNGELAQNTLFYPANPQHKSLRRHFKNSDVSCLCNTVVKPGTRNPGQKIAEEHGDPPLLQGETPVEDETPVAALHSALWILKKVHVNHAVIPGASTTYSFYSCVPARPSSQEQLQEAWESKPAVLVAISQDDFELLYGPTLATQAQFMLSLGDLSAVPPSLQAPARAHPRESPQLGIITTRSTSSATIPSSEAETVTRKRPPTSSRKRRTTDPAPMTLYFSLELELTHRLGDPQAPVLTSCVNGKLPGTTGCCVTTHLSVMGEDALKLEITGIAPQLHFPTASPIPSQPRTVVVELTITGDLSPLHTATVELPMLTTIAADLTLLTAVIVGPPLLTTALPLAPQAPSALPLRRMPNGPILLIGEAVIVSATVRCGSFVLTNTTDVVHSSVNVQIKYKWKT